MVHCSRKECLTAQPTANKSFDDEITYNFGKGKRKFKGICLKQDSAPFICGNAVTFYISYKLDTWSRDLNTDFTLGKSSWENFQVAGVKVLLVLVLI